ncbi:hypothetical protein PLESTB_001290900 [Pleodorina starrii]|uniref:Vacuolar protein 8 n=1 Tax=Pleodorina starrii TaxID=330485 RepID=A0A9W6F6T4_9CHLO|nr:hypothetical protein PLESTB_001290900 [Pleodorina starrii]
MPLAIRRADMRLLKIAAVLNWSQLKVYEDVDAEAEALQVPYADTDDELWKRVVTISWRWAKRKPGANEPGFSPMSDIQFRELKATLQHAVDSGAEYVWIDWSCVPQDYSVDSMVEVLRSKVFYARARFMYILPTFEDLPEGPVGVILDEARKVLGTRASAAAADETESLQCAVAESVIGAILEKNRTAGREYFGRVWTLAERMARHGRSEGLCNWLSLESWLGMVVDAMVKSTEDKDSSIIYKKMLGQNAAGLLKEVLGPLAKAVRLGGVQAEACDGLEDKVADLCVAAVGVWLSPSNLEEAPTREWLKMYLGQEARSGIYQAWSEADRVWAIYSYFCWKRLDQRSEAGLRMALDDLAETAGGDKGTYVQGMYAQLGIAPEMDRQQDKLEAAPTASQWWLALVLCGNTNKVGAQAAEITRLVGLLKSRDINIKKKAAMSLMTLAQDDANNVAIANAGGIPPLVKLLDSSDTGIQEQAARALASLAENDANRRVAIAKAGGIPPLVKLLDSSDTGLQQQAAGALAKLAVNDANQAAIANTGGIPPLVKLLDSSDTGLQQQAAGALAKLAVNDANRVAIAEAGGIPPLVKLLDSSDTGLQTQAAGALAKLAENDANQAAIANTGGIPPLVKLLDSSDTGLQTQAARALAKLAENDANQDSIAQAAGIPPLVKRVRGSSDIGVQKWAAWALANLAVNDANQVAIANAGGIPPLVKLLNSSDTGVQEQAARALANLSVNDANQAAIVQADGISPLLKLVLDSSDTGVQEQAARALAKLAANDANQAFIVSDIRPLVGLLNRPDSRTDLHMIAAGSLATFANINIANRAAIANAGGIPPLVRLLDSWNTDVQEQAARALAALADKYEASMVLIAKAGGIPPLVKLLDSSNTGVQQWAARALANLSENDANRVAIDKAVETSLLVKLVHDSWDTGVRSRSSLHMHPTYISITWQIHLPPPGAAFRARRVRAGRSQWALRVCMSYEVLAGCTAGGGNERGLAMVGGAGLPVSSYHWVLYLNLPASDCGLAVRSLYLELVRQLVCARGPAAVLIPSTNMHIYLRYCWCVRPAS